MTSTALDDSLAGIKIVGFTQFLLGPACTRYLVNLGASLVKVEPPQGAWERQWAGAEAFIEGVSMFFVAANGGARSVAIDLKSEPGQVLVDELIADADVVVSNYRPSAAHRLGITFDRAKRANPKVVFAKASGYGEGAQWQDLPGQDLLLQARGGLMSLTGSTEPRPCGAAIVDQHGAALLGMGILAGLIKRDRTNESVEVEVTMMGSALDLMTEPLAYALNGGQFDELHDGLASRSHAAPYGTYKLIDGHIVISLSPIDALARAIMDEELVAISSGPGAYARRRDIYDRVAEAIESWDVASAVRRLREAGVWCEEVVDIADVAQDEWVREHEWVRPASTLGLSGLSMPRSPLGTGAAEHLGRAPGLGEHTDSVLLELGYSRDAIAELRELGAVR